jgi:hypothetical protein
MPHGARCASCELKTDAVWRPSPRTPEGSSPRGDPKFGMPKCYLRSDPAARCTSGWISGRQSLRCRVCRGYSLILGCAADAINGVRKRPHSGERRCARLNSFSGAALILCGAIGPLGVFRRGRAL